MKRKRDNNDHIVKKLKLCPEINDGLSSVKTEPVKKLKEKKKTKKIALKGNKIQNNLAKTIDIDSDKLHKKHKISIESESVTNKVKSKNKRTVHFEEMVEVKTGSSNEKTFDKLKEDVTDSTATINVIAEINSHNKNKKSKKARKAEKLCEISKLVQEQCVEYLKKWKHNKDSWKFEKAKQNRLINYMFDSTKLPDDIFNIFIEYINGSKGNIVKIVSEKCLLIIKEMEDYLELNEEEQSGKTKPDESKYERARSLLQSVQDFAS